MSNGLIAVHIGFIVALVVSVWYSGHRQGRKDMVEQFMLDQLVSPAQLIEYYKKRNQQEEIDDNL